MGFIFLGHAAVKCISHNSIIFLESPSNFGTSCIVYFHLNYWSKQNLKQWNDFRWTKNAIHNLFFLSITFFFIWKIDVKSERAKIERASPERRLLCEMNSRNIENNLHLLPLCNLKIDMYDETTNKYVLVKYISLFSNEFEIWMPLSS